MTVTIFMMNRLFNSKLKKLKTCPYQQKLKTCPYQQKLKTCPYQHACMTYNKEHTNEALKRVVQLIITDQENSPSYNLELKKFIAKSSMEHR